MDADRPIAQGLSILGLIEKNPARHHEALRHSVSTHYVRCQILIALSQTLSELDRQPEATAAASEALEMARERSFQFQEGAALTALAEISLATGDKTAAASYASDASAIHEVTGADGLLNRLRTLTRIH